MRSHIAQVVSLPFYGFQYFIIMPRYKNRLNVFLKDCSFSSFKTGSANSYLHLFLLKSLRMDTSALRFGVSLRRMCSNRPLSAQRCRGTCLGGYQHQTECSWFLHLVLLWS